MTTFYKMYRLDREDDLGVPYSVKYAVAEVYMEKDDTLVSLPFVQKQTNEVLVVHHKAELRSKAHLFVKYK